MTATRRARGLGGAFAALWGATAASNLADGVAVTLLPLAAAQAARSPGGVALVAGAYMSAWPLFGLLSGWVVDLVNRRRLLIAVNTARALVLVAVAVCAAGGRLSIPVLCAAALLIGVGETLADTALTSMVPAVVPPERRGVANARLESAINVLNQLVGPPLAGALLAAGAALAAGAGGGIYAVALVGLLLLPRRRFAVTAARAEGEGWRRELLAGLRTLWSQRLLRRLTVLTAAMNVAWGVWAALFVVYAVEPGPLGLSAPEYGALLAAMAVGGLLVAPAVDLLVRTLGVRRVLLLDLIGTVLLVAPAALGLGVAPTVVGVIVAGAGATVWRAIVATIRQNVTEHRLLGRVYAASRFISWGVAPLAALLAAALADTAGTRTAFAAAAALALTLVAWFPFAITADETRAAYTGARDTPAAAPTGPSLSGSDAVAETV